MLHRHKHSWSHNELFAHKKNTGEQAKLRDTMLRIDKKFGMVKDSIRQEATQVRTSLKCLRKSTGHSIDALPPTPFQIKDLRDDTFLSIMEPSCISGRSQLNPEYDYVFDEIADIGNNNSNVEDDSNTNNCKERYISYKTGIDRTDSRTAQSSKTNTELSTTYSLNDIPNNDRNCIDKNNSNVSLLPPIETGEYLINTMQQGDFKSAQDLETSNDKAPGFPLESKENTMITISSDRKLPSSFWYSSLSNNTNSHNYNNHSKESILQRRRDQQNVRNRPNDSDSSQMRDTRTRCRTCLERYRQNLEFQRQKKLLQQEQQGKKNSGNMTSHQVPANKLLLVTDDDLNSLFAESEVLDFEDTKPLPTRRKNNTGPKKGYSKVRLQQLAEPRKGRRKKALFSKQLIKKEVDDMTERHSQPLLTEREKERIRILESKIRMFLAVTSASGDVMPSSMVHIPQREDVMTVDISHL